MGISRLPLASLIAGILTLTLSACGGEPIVFNGNVAPVSSVAASDSSAATASSETTASSPESSAAISSSLTSSASSVSTGSTSPQSSSSLQSSSVQSSSIASSSAAATGRELYNSAALGCSTCHGATGDGGTSQTPLIPEDWTKSQLATTIKTSMPQQTGIYKGKFCDQACADKIADYIKGGFAATASALPTQLLKQTAASSTPALSLLNSNEPNCGAAYSNTDLRALSRLEYSAAIFQLVGIDLTGEFGQTSLNTLPADNPGTEISSDALESYTLVANKIVEELSSNNFAGVIDCANLTSEACSGRLIDDFACKAFRRPLTNLERSHYLSIYTTGSDTQDGIKKVAKTILASADFINRSNIGLSQIAREDNANTALLMASAASLLDGKTLAIYQKNTLSTNFSGSDLLQVSIKATQNAVGLWPVMRVQVGDATFVDLLVNQPEASYTFHITGLHGNNSITIANQPTGAALEYQAGHNLVISSIKVALSY